MNTAQVISILLILTALPYLLLVGIILKRGRLRRGTTSLLLLYIIISLFSTLFQVAFHMTWPLTSAPAFTARLMLYGLVVSSWLLFHLTQPFLGLGLAGRIWWILPATWIGLLVFLTEDPLSLGWLSALGILESDQVGFILLYLTWSGLVSGAALLTARTHHRTLQPLRRNRIKYWFLVLALSVFAAASLFAGQDLLASTLQLLAVLTASYVILSYGLLDVRQMMRHILSYTLATLLALTLYLVALLLAGRFFGALSSYSIMVAGAVIALVLALAFGPLLRLVQRLVNRITRGSSYDPGGTLREYSAKISGILELDHLAREIVELVCDKMAVQRGVLFLVHYSEEKDGKGGEGGHFSLEAIAEPESPTRLTLLLRSPIANYLQNRRQPLTQYDIDILPLFRHIPVEERQWFAELDMDVYVPVFGKGQWIGLLALGRRVSGDRFFEDDLALLATLADQTAVALENARLYDDLRIRNEENERLNQQLTTANIELSRIGQAKSDFIDIASHELRTPLTQVTGYNEMLGEMIGTDSLEQTVGVEMTDRVRQAADRLEKIVATMLDVSRIDTETLALDISPVRISIILQRVAHTWAAALEQRKQILEIGDVDQLPIIMADGERLVQLFSSLVQNAIKYTPDGGHIRITGRLVNDDQGRSVEMIVADTGVGIARADLGRIFEKFYRVDDVLFHSSGDIKFKGAGPGLGLTIARGIVEAHGGAIWAESRGRDEDAYPGAEFHVLIPERTQPLDIARLEPAKELEARSTQTIASVESST